MLELARVIDMLGRVKIPTTIWKTLRCEEGQEFEMTVEYGKLYIKKYDPQEDIYTKPFTGIVRWVDKCHRLCIPSEYISILDIEKGNGIIVTFEEDGRLRITKTNKK